MNKRFRLYIISVAILGFFHLGTLHAQTCYVSSLNGDDGNDGTGSETAWATIERVNRAIPSLKPGNSVLFERGGIYYGSIVVNDVSGSVDNPITFGAYGEGEMPIISGAKQITGWEQIDENLWQADVPERPGSIDVLFIDGKKYYPARFPNKGYRTVTDHYSGGLQDNTLDFPDGYWNGATVAYKIQEYFILRDTVNYSYSDGRIDKIGNNHTETPDPEWGYFLQNHINALDTPGEWVYDKRDGALILLTRENPNSQLVEYMDAEHGIEINCYSSEDRNCYINVEDLCFQYFRNYAVLGHYGKHLTIRRNVVGKDWHNLQLLLLLPRTSMLTCLLHILTTPVAKV